MIFKPCTFILRRIVTRHKVYSSTQNCIPGFFHRSLIKEYKLLKFIEPSLFDVFFCRESDYSLASFQMYRGGKILLAPLGLLSLVNISEVLTLILIVFSVFVFYIWASFRENFTLLYANNECTYLPVHLHSPISEFAIHYLESPLAKPATCNI